VQSPSFCCFWIYDDAESRGGGNMRQRLLTSWGTGNREGEETEWPEIIYSLQRHTPSHPLASGRPHLLKVLPPPRIGPPNTVLGA
jgi:hypothetical protein